MSNQNNSEQGFGMMEVLVALTIVAIVGLGVTMNAMGAMQIAKRTEINYLASNLALSKVEDLAAVDPESLDSSDNLTEVDLTITGTAIKFQRVTTIVVNADQSRTATVVVSSQSSAVPTSAQFTTRISLWD